MSRAELEMPRGRVCTLGRSKQERLRTTHAAGMFIIDHFQISDTEGHPIPSDEAYVSRSDHTGKNVH